jgi:hypothetical protein
MNEQPKCELCDAPATTVVCDITLGEPNGPWATREPNGEHLFCDAHARLPQGAGRAEVSALREGRT